MPWMIDGHNLIPHVAGLSLSDPDDEMRLVERLQQFCARRNTRVEVYFDRAAAGQAGRRGFGAVVAVFVPADRTADQAITARLRALGRAARQWTVVSSDREVQRAARWAQARVVSAAEFARRLNAPATDTAASAGENKPEHLSEAEIEAWLRLFWGENDAP